MSSPHRLHRTQTQALSHPVRLGILALYTRNRERSLAADDLLADLIESDADTFRDIDAGQVFYHRVCLQDADLLPA